ncbi:energy transducer TonB [Sphingopyxis sp. QXT-31]|uniref:energy transducer TonB n=1 Tax=Sphingopyxis sp. QXT-31 TaxID=1357916 RepID=UPI0009793F45|nr:energy transducer TonB [Sphingopyxis sp. QXT-31]APZ97891.1 energy transducer TonB [Sphingopyxis sp. QXT-31]
MTYTGQVSNGQRVIAGGGALLGLLVVGLGLASGLDLSAVRTASEAISAIALPAPKSPEPISVPTETPSDKAAGAASAANRNAKATSVVAPKPKLPPPVPPPVAAAPKPGSASDASAGAAPVAGPGSGAAGRGDGLGAGGSGSGSGGGTRPAWRSGTIEDRDYPREARRAKIGGEVEVRFTIEATGRVTGCRVSKSSGDAALDAATCRLIEERFRFKPATNAGGIAVASSYGWRQTWWLEHR